MRASLPLRSGRPRSSPSARKLFAGATDLPQWLVLACVPVLALLIMLAWLAFMIGRTKIAVFSLKGLGLSISVRAAGDAHSRINDLTDNFVKEDTP